MEISPLGIIYGLLSIVSQRFHENHRLSPLTRSNFLAPAAAGQNVTEGKKLTLFSAILVSGLSQITLKSQIKSADAV